jgi:hypothetical protein
MLTVVSRNLKIVYTITEEEKQGAEDIISSSTQTM